ncbi:MAG TPA: TIGR03435 family protein [Bryobacteraceae bacterium]|nr:TIGR03435 family protein [Bryobacteraceae bacterium]
MDRKQKLILTSTCFAVVLGQTQTTSARPEFEVASIKPNHGGGPRVFIGEKSPGTFAGDNVTLQGLIQEAYGMTIERPWLPFRIAPKQGVQILAGPGWTASDRFDVVGKWKATPVGQHRTIESEQKAQSDAHLMLQALLEERFRLKVHREMKDLPIYELTIAKSTDKLRQGSCTIFDPAAPPLTLNQSAPNYCGNSRIGRKALDWTLDGTAMSMTDLAGTLSLVIGRRAVVDNTGFAGTFDVHLQWTPGLGETGDSDVPAPADGSSPSIFSVLQEQLGLKLKAGRGSVEVLVIDYAEKPSAN